MGLGIGGDGAGSVAFGSVGSSYGTLKNFIGTANDIVGLIFTNTTDKEMAISLDAGTTTAFFMPAASMLQINLKSYGLSIAPHVQVKYVAAPGSGNVSVGAISISPP